MGKPKIHSQEKAPGVVEEPGSDGTPTRSPTQQALQSIKLTDYINQGGAAPGTLDGELQQSSSGQSLFQVVEMAIEDILNSDYQTREAEDPEHFTRLVTSIRQQPPADFKDALPVRKHPSVPGKYQLVRGGHTRLKAAKAAGLLTYPVIIVDYDNKRSALATARENLARDELSPPAEGRLYLLLRKEWGYSQDDLGEELGIKRDRIKECEAAAKSAPHILEMFQRLKALGGDANRGLRAAKCLRRLDECEKREAGLAARLCAPLIDLFVYERVTTDVIDIATKRLLEADDPLALLATIVQEFNQHVQATEAEQDSASPKQAQHPKESQPAPEIQRSEKLGLVTRRFRQFLQLMGKQPPSEPERKALLNLQKEISQLLTRQ